MHIDWWTLGLQTINALVLVWLLARYLFRPVAKIIAARQQAATDLIADATGARAAAIADRQRAADEVVSIARQRNDMLVTTTEEAEKLKASIESAAHVDANRLRSAAQVEIENAQLAAADGDADRASRLAIDIAAKLLDRLPQQIRVAGFIDGLASELAKLPDESRTELGRDGAMVRLIVPRALQTDELAACHAALIRVLGHDAQLLVSIDATVLAGLELETPHAIVRNSFRADLAYLQTELLTHDEDHA